MAEDMMFNSLYVELTCADTASLIRSIGNRGILIREVCNIDLLTVRFRCSSKDLHSIKMQAERFGGHVKILSSNTFKDVFICFFKRPAIIIAFFLLLTLVIYLPSRVLFIQVEGNSTVPRSKVLEAAEACGIRFGASRRLVRSEKMKNALLGELPQLQWAGINTSGCLATISVREREEESTDDIRGTVGNIVAENDGIIRSCTVYKGTPLCYPGDAITAGQTLVSGYVDCGLSIKSVRAQAEIDAYTIRRISAITPTLAAVRHEITHEETTYSLLIGKKLINFYKDSGISDATCVKMYSEKYLTLPGGFRLPIAVVIQRTICYVTEMKNLENAFLSDYCEQYLLSNMQAGQILNQSVQFLNGNDVCFFDGEYICLEMIGQFVDEEIINNDGQTN